MTTVTLKVHKLVFPNSSDYDWDVDGKTNADIQDAVSDAVDFFDGHGITINVVGVSEDSMPTTFTGNETTQEIKTKLMTMPVSTSGADVHMCFLGAITPNYTGLVGHPKAFVDINATYAGIVTSHEVGHLFGLMHPSNPPPNNIMALNGTPYSPGLVAAQVTVAKNYIASNY